MPIAYGFTAEEPENTRNEDERASYRSSEGVRYPVAQSQAAMNKEDQKQNMWSRGDVGHEENITRLPSESREELITRIKRDQKATWLQGVREERVEDSPTGSLFTLSKPVLLPALEIGDQNSALHGNREQHVEHGLSIERPRSALHAGDFRQRRDDGGYPDSPRPSTPHSRGHFMSASPTTPWYPSQIGLQQPLMSHSVQTPAHDFSNGRRATSRNRASSYSALSSSFIFRPPTSPLAKLSNSSDFEFDDGTKPSIHSPDKAYRRRTFSPSSLQLSESSIHHEESRGVGWSASGSTRTDRRTPYQAHQPRRSVTGFPHPHSYSDFPMSSSRTRRPSMSGDASPLQHAPMVGGYEESILRGRMSTLPSKPLDFVAQIGVLGKGNCKPSLKCPPHIAVPFPAVFYAYSPHKPSPYVGQVDLEAQLKPPRPVNARGSRRSQSPESDAGGNQKRGNEKQLNDAIRDGPTFVAKQRRRQISKRAPNGSYRIPQQGQLQIVIKNPNKTAVKLFLVPYDLTGMESGQKTFIRQRSYSVGPIIDLPPNLSSTLETDGLTNPDDSKDKPVLHYSILLHICCPCHGRYYVYKIIRVVFANRVPDRKEKLRVETEWPEPKYSVYKPEPSHSSRGRTNDIAIVIPPPVNPHQHRHVSYPGPVTSDDPFSSNSTTDPASTYTSHLTQEPRPALAFPRLPPLRTLSRISDNGSSSATGDSMSLDNRDTPLSPKSAAPSRLQSPISWTSPPPPASTRGISDTSERTSSPGVRPPAREGLLALQFRDWAEQRRGLGYGGG